MSQTAFSIVTSAFSFPTFYLQRGIVVMGLIDAFVYAHNYHRHNADNPGKFQGCMEGRIRLVTAITPACVHAHRAVCLARRPLDINPYH